MAFSRTNLNKNVRCHSWECSPSHQTSRHKFTVLKMSKIISSRYLCIPYYSRWKKLMTGIRSRLQMNIWRKWQIKFLENKIWLVVDLHNNRNSLLWQGITSPKEVSKVRFLISRLIINEEKRDGKNLFEKLIQLRNFHFEYTNTQKFLNIFVTNFRLNFGD